MGNLGKSRVKITHTAMRVISFAIDPPIVVASVFKVKCVEVSSGDALALCVQAEKIPLLGRRRKDSPCEADRDNKERDRVTNVHWSPLSLLLSRFDTLSGANSARPRPVCAIPARCRFHYRAFLSGFGVECRESIVNR